MGNIDVQVLVDGGSSDTYLQPCIIQFLKVPIESTLRFHVLVGNGHSLTVEGIVRQLNHQVQRHELVIPFWLTTSGPHIADYATLTLKFYQNGKFRCVECNLVVFAVQMITP